MVLRALMSAGKHWGRRFGILEGVKIDTTQPAAHLDAPMHLRIENSSNALRLNRGQRVEQGGVHVGFGPMHTILRSCLCVGMHHASSKVGGISHITGFSQEDGHSPEGAVQLLLRALRRQGVEAAECEWFLLGGSEPARHVHDAAVACLKASGIGYETLDVLGRYHRKLMLDPAASLLQLYKKPAGGSPEDGVAGQFVDPERRIVTGASLLFRNERLLEVFRETMLPITAGKRCRCHVWCAGCSNGMEVYSMAMVGLNWLAERGRRADVLFLGSDISEEALKVASEGRYLVAGQAAEGRYHSLLQRYAKREGNRQVRMGRALREVVRFRHRDIVSGSKGHLFDVIVCDHVLQYFSPSDQEQMTAALVRAAAPDAFLYISTPTRAIAEFITGRLGCRMFGRHLYRAPI